jgi:hypothetical protein
MQYPETPSSRRPGLGRWCQPAALVTLGALVASCAVAPVMTASLPTPTSLLAAPAAARQCLHRATSRSEGRPKARFSLRSDRFPLTVHWQDEGRRVKAAALLHHVEAAWQREIVELGWTVPLPDAGKGGDDTLDLYLVKLGPGQAYVAEEHRQTKPYAAASTYVAFDHDLPDDGTLESYAFHEFNHVCQYATDANEGDAFYENAASFMDRFLKPNGPASQTGIADFQSHPELSLDFIGDKAGEYEYGAGIFLQFLVERYAKGRPDLVRKLWEAGRQPDVSGAADRNEPDWQDVLPAVLREYQGPDAESALTAFEAWRLQAALAKPAALPKPALIVDGGHPEQVQPSAKQRPAPWGANFLKLDTNGAKQLTLRLAEGGTSHWRLWLGTQAADGSWTMIQSSKGDVAPTVSLALGSAPRVYAVVVNLGDGKHDPDRKDWAGQRYRLTLDWSR